MPGFDREYKNGSKVLFRGPWSQLVRLENVPRFVKPELPKGHKISSLSAVCVFDRNGDIESITGFVWRVFVSSDARFTGGTSFFYTTPAEIAYRHSWNIPNRADGSAEFYNLDHFLCYSDLLGGWHLR